MPTQNKPNTLIIGGTSGLGLELALLFNQTHNTFITGRRDPKNDNLTFMSLDLDFQKPLAKDLDQLVTKLPQIDLLIYVAGFYQEGTISDLSDADLANMNHVGLLAPAMLLQRILKKQKGLAGFIAITSTSQWTPRRLEPMYTAVKAGLGTLANSIALDERIGKVLVAGPGGMNTKFWENSPRDLSAMLNPKWVAEQIASAYEGGFRYKCIRLPRESATVEVIEMRS